MKLFKNYDACLMPVWNRKLVGYTLKKVKIIGPTHNRSTGNVDHQIMWSSDISYTLWFEIYSIDMYRRSSQIIILMHSFAEKQVYYLDLVINM